MDFMSAVKRGADSFKRTEGPVRVVSHLAFWEIE